MRMSKRHGLRAVSSRSRIQRLICRRDPLSIESKFQVSIVNYQLVNLIRILTYPVEDIVCSFSSISALVKTSRDC